MNGDHSVIFEIAPKYCISDSFVDYDGYSISSKGFLPTVVDITQPSELNSLIPVHFSSLIPKISMFTLAISCLTTSNLPWFMDLTFQIPMQYCSLQHRTLLPSPVSSTTGHCFHFDCISSIFLELFLHSSGSILGTFHPGSLPFIVISFCLFILFMRLSRQEFWSGLLFPSPVDYILSELSFLKLDKAVIHAKFRWWLVFLVIL